MRIAPRTTLCATGWRVHAKIPLRGSRSCADLARWPVTRPRWPWHLRADSEYTQRGEIQKASRLASEQLALLESIGDPSLTAQAGFGAMGIKAQVGEYARGMRWSQATIDWATAIPRRATSFVGSPLAAALALRGVARWWFGVPGGARTSTRRCDRRSAEALTLAVSTSWTYGTRNYERVLRVDDAAVAILENALRTVEASG